MKKCRRNDDRTDTRLRLRGGSRDPGAAGGQALDRAGGGRRRRLVPARAGRFQRLARHARSQLDGTLKVRGIAVDVVEETVVVGRHELSVVRPRDSEALLDEDAFEHEEYLPYWAELWPSGVALARTVARRSVGGVRAVELGCGLALPSIAAALGGARALATDWSGDALRFAALNAERNGAALETMVAAWTAPAPLVRRGPFDLVLGSDLLYERRNVDLLLALLPELVAPGGEILLADPGRPHAAAFVEQAGQRFRLATSRSTDRPNLAIHRLTRDV